MRHVILACMAIVATFYTAFLVLFLGFIVPRRGESLLSAFRRSKRSRDHLIPMQTICCAGMDVLLCLLPLPMVWSLQLSTRKKLGVCALLLTGML
jgi:hypothetical protein